jgi:stage V sporulation protein D (sporulation-specific penicillin-binding protein)
MEKTDKITKKFTSKMQANLLLVFCIVTICLIGLMGRLVYIMQTRGDAYAKQVLSRETYVSSVLPYKRGDITDRNGTVLASSALQYKLILDPKHLLLNEDSIQPTFAALQMNFDITAEELQDILDKKSESQYVIVLKNLQYDAVENFKKAMQENKEITGVWFEEDYVRTYPYQNLACDVIGFTSVDNIGYFGIEEYYNDELNGINGREYGYFDSSLDLERIVKKAVNGNSIISTIDINAQRIIQKHINTFNTEFGSKNIGILVMNPNNGEILAMASNQEYDLNNPRDLSGLYTEAELSAMTEEQKMEALNTLWKNDTISFGYEPGSTFKPITVAAGLEENIVKEEDTFYCDGIQVVGQDKIHCSKRAGHGEVTLGQALMLSCNDALMQIADKEERGTFYQYQTNFGFGKKTGIDLPGEEAGIIIEKDKIGPSDLATSSFGQTFNATMIQMAAAYSSLVNGGSYYQPHVVKKIINDNGAVVKENKGLLVKRTVSEKTSDFIQKYMYQTVEEGTAGGAKVEGYAIGGKTGTAQKYPRSAKTYLVSFLGQVPAIDPQIVIYVIVDEPQNVEKQADSSIATKFASRIMAELLPALGIYPEGDIDYLLSTEPAANEADPEANPGANPENNSGSDQPQDNQNQTQEPGTDPSSGDNTAAAQKPSQGDNPSSQTEGSTEENNENSGQESGNSEQQPESGSEAEQQQENTEGEGTPSEEDENEFNADALE